MDPDEIEERKRAVAEEKAARAREKQAALAEHERVKERQLADRQRPSESDEVRLLDRLRERHRASFEAECARRNPDPLLEALFQQKYPAAHQEQLTAWARARELEGSTDEMRATRELDAAFRNRAALLTLLVENSARPPAASWPIVAQALKEAFPDRFHTYFVPLARHLWSIPRERTWSGCRLCGLTEEGSLVTAIGDRLSSRWLRKEESIPEASQLRALLCLTCVRAVIAWIDQTAAAVPAEGLDEGRLRADVLRAVQSLAPPDEADPAVVEVERWLAVPVVKEPMVAAPAQVPALEQVDRHGNPAQLRYYYLCNICMSPADGTPTAIIPDPAEPDQPYWSRVFCRSCLVQAPRH